MASMATDSLASLSNMEAQNHICHTMFLECYAQHPARPLNCHDLSTLQREAQKYLEMISKQRYAMEIFVLFCLIKTSPFSMGQISLWPQYLLPSSKELGNYSWSSTPLLSLFSAPQSLGYRETESWGLQPCVNGSLHAMVDLCLIQQRPALPCRFRALCPCTQRCRSWLFVSL